MGALARPVGEADQLLLAFGRRANDDKNALLLILEPRLKVDAVRPDIDIAPGREIALLPAFVFSDPPFLQPRDGGCRQTGSVLAEKRSKGLFEGPGRDALQVKDREQCIEALRAPRIRRKDRGCEADAFGSSAPASRSRTRGWRTATGPMPVMTSRSGR